MPQRLSYMNSINRQTVEPRWVVIENLIDHLRIDFTSGFKPSQSEQLAVIIGVALIRADHQALFSPEYFNT
jgi:hypothetical protein